MRKIELVVLVLLAISIFSGTAAEKTKAPKMPGDMRYSEYTGFDAMEWDTSSAALADTSYDLTVYRGWPSKPYVVIGDIRHRDPNRRWEEGQIRDAVKGAKRVGGEAIIIRLTSESGVRAFTGIAGKGAASGISSGHAETTALVIRWQTPQEVNERTDRNLRLFKRFLAAKPSLNLKANDETATFVIKFLLQSGISEASPEFNERYQQMMTRVSPNAPGDFSGEWMFKAILKESGLVSGREEHHLGVASVRMDRDSIAIVSTEGKTEMNFSGENTKGRLTGQAGVAGYSAKAEGVALDEKISVTFQSLTPNGVVQGTIVLQRNRLK